ncbi:MAG: metalloregulator ArsR/SmtB family transcription factor [Candidatus Aenigmarchaeota archaeon]|nr:metalloregulator ArsR/SmtB family transcription factor [Candidatus Aenigmarchaeota archaeon]
MEITKKTIKALASDTRLSILKILVKRRRIAADLAKDLNLAPSTINEHLKKLEESGLVEKKDSGHKWFYYDITKEGRDLVKPKAPVQFILILSLGILMMIIGGSYSLSRNFGMVFTRRISEQATLVATSGAKAVDTVETLSTASELNFVFMVLFVIGIILALVGLYKIIKR